jgi:type II secretory pathway predicted ATPase ExeA
VYPAILDNSRITASSLVDAIIMDISEERPKRALEPKSRQALKLLRNRAASGMKQVLMIEEAHQLNLAALKTLKRIYELEDGFRRLIGIILIGQPELKYLLDETVDQNIREVARRVTQAEITGLGDDLGRYLAHKFARVGKQSGEIFNGDSFAAMQRRLQDKISRKTVSKAYPLSVNNLAANAMNLAAETGEPKVSEEVVMAV